MFRHLIIKESKAPQFVCDTLGRGRPRSVTRSLRRRTPAAPAPYYLY